MKMCISCLVFLTSVFILVCLIPPKNAKCQLLWNDEMQNTKIFRVLFSFIQNAEFIALIVAS